MPHRRRIPPEPVWAALILTAAVAAELVTRARYVPRPSIAVLITGLALHAFLASRIRARHQRRFRGLCPQCGYDCRATPTRCPECGTIRSAPPNDGTRSPRAPTYK